MFVSLFSFVLGFVDQTLNIFLATMFCMWMPWELQGVYLLGIFVASVMCLGERPSLKSTMRNYKSRLRKARRNRGASRSSKWRTQTFHRRRLPYLLVRRCCRR